MPIRKRTWINKNGIKNYSYEASYTQNNGKRKKKSFKEKRIAERWLVNNYLNFQNVEQISDKNSNQTVDYYWSKYLNHIKLNNSPGTVEIRKWAYSCIVQPQLGEIKIKRLGKKEILNFCQNMKSKTGSTISPNSIRSAYQTLISILDCALEDGACSTNVAKDLKKNRFNKIIPSTPKKEKIISDLIQLGQITDKIIKKSYHLAIMFQLMFLTGIRIGEACALNSSDFNFEKGIFIVSKTVSNAGGFHEGPTKNKKIRILGIPPVILMGLLEVAQLNNFEGKMFRNSRNNPIRPDAFRTTFLYPACKAVGIVFGRDGFSAHSTRFSAISLAVDFDVNQMDVKEIAGHSKLSTTMDIYANRIKPEVIKGINILSKKYEESEQRRKGVKTAKFIVEPKRDLAVQAAKNGTKMEQSDSRPSQMTKSVRDSKGFEGKQSYLIDKYVTFKSLRSFCDQDHDR